MKTWKYIFIALSGAFLTSALILSCKKDRELKSYTFDATIKDAGNVTADGCGWQLIADSTYHPVNLDTRYQMNGLRVNVTYHKLDNYYYCGNIAPAMFARLGIPIIVIDKIQVKQ